jgi:hypothetical protein
MERDIAFLMETMKLGYQDTYQMPYSRRQRLVEWKEDQLKEQARAQQEAESRARRR